MGKLQVLLSSSLLVLALQFSSDLLNLSYVQAQSTILAQKIIDFDGDGKLDPGVTYLAPSSPLQSTRKLLHRNVMSRSGQVAEIDFGINGDIPAYGDYYASGKTNLAVYSQERTGARFLKILKPDTTETKIPFPSVGMTGGSLLTGCDFNGDKATDLAMLSPSSKGFEFEWLNVVKGQAIRFSQGSHLETSAASFLATCGDLTPVIPGDELVVVWKTIERVPTLRITPNLLIISSTGLVIKSKIVSGYGEPFVLDMEGDGKKEIALTRVTPSATSTLRSTFWAGLYDSALNPYSEKPTREFSDIPTPYLGNLSVLPAGIFGFVEGALNRGEDEFIFLVDTNESKEMTRFGLNLYTGNYNKRGLANGRGSQMKIVNFGQIKLQ